MYLKEKCVQRSGIRSICNISCCAVFASLTGPPALPKSMEVQSPASTVKIKVPGGRSAAGGAIAHGSGRKRVATSGASLVAKSGSNGSSRQRPHQIPDEIYGAGSEILRRVAAGAANVSCGGLHLHHPYERSAPL